MKYMLLIYTDEQGWTEAERQLCYGESTDLAQELKVGKNLTPELREQEQRLWQQVAAKQ